MNIIISFLNQIMTGCYNACGNYGIAIVLFTFISKIILLPLFIWTYFNSIKMIKIQPDINNIKVKFYGQKDIIAEEEAKLQKEQGYHPILSTIPLIIQLLLLMGVVEAIKLGIADPSINMDFAGTDLSIIPNDIGLSYIWVPVVAGISSWILCIAQNKSNVLQAEQSNANKYGTMALSVGISLYLGYYVYIGTALYWICSNLMAVLQLYIMNGIVRPKRYVDYERLNKSREELLNLQNIGGKKKLGADREIRKKERKDYKKFFSVVNKHLVFYSESNGFYKYFKGYIEYILEHTNITVHYITSDPDDNIFNMEKENPQIRGYYIGENKLITLMMKMDADVVVMTMPDIENYHIKRSYIRKDIEYILVPHGLGSNNLTFRTGSMDHYDTILCPGPYWVEEIRKLEDLRHTPVKNVVETGYPLIDDMKKSHEAVEKNSGSKEKLVLIAPSWQADNIIDGCLEAILDELKKTDYKVIVRPHPQEVKLKKAHIEKIKQKYDSDMVTVTMDFTSHNPVMEADVLITDWSDISFEYAYTTKRPILFINTPMKVMNPEWQQIDTVPVNIAIRDVFGTNLDTDKLDKLNQTIDELLADSDKYRQQITDFEKVNLYNHGSSAEVGGKYIIKAVQEKVKSRKS